MEFPYIKVIDFPKHQLRQRSLPWVRFGVFNPKNKDKIIYPLGLVDSGSTITIIDHEIGKNLGFDIKKVEKRFKGKVFGVGGGSIEVYFHKVGFSIDDGKSKRPIVYQDFVGFTYQKFPSSMPQQTAILGLKGFFSHLEVTFKHPRFVAVKTLR